MASNKKRDPRIRSALLCDEVRPEANGKQMLLGIYTGDVMLQSFPASFAVAIYLDLELPEGTHHLHIRLKSGEKIHAGMEGDVVVLKTSLFGLTTPRLPIQVDGEGELVVEVQIDGGSWSVALTKTMLEGTAAGPT